MRKSTLAGSLLLLAAFGMAQAGEQATYSTPQEVFEAARKAAQKQNWKGVCATLTAESRDALAGALALAPVSLLARAKLAGVKEEKFKPKLKPLYDALAKHGLTEERLNNLLNDSSLTDPNQAIKLPVEKLLAPIVDRCAFISDMYKALQKINESKAQQGPIAANARLMDVKISDEKAKGIIVSKVNGKELRQPIAFRKIDDNWKIELPLPGVKKSEKGKKSGKGKR